ncbi:MAG: aminotransferase class IV family protein [Bryobacterales bacterium]|nr:aminotransferase class IV family protein [Bryobacterales bacterium]
MHRFLLHNGEIRDTSENLVSPGQVGLLNGWGVFSTLRVKEGVLFAWERHYARMKKDAELMHIPFPADAEAMRLELLRLVEANGSPDATLRVAVIRNRGGMFEGPAISRDYDMVAFTKGLTDWKGGVRLMTKAQARHGDSPFSGAKILSWSMNLTMLEEAQSKGFDEMLLLDHRGMVSECTSANIFIVEGSRVLTPPLTAGCLPGVTRALLLEEVRADGVRVEEEEIAPERLLAADDVFLTSSTRDLLGVGCVDGRTLTPQPQTREKLLGAFQSYLDDYVAQRRAAAAL